MKKTLFVLALVAVAMTMGTTTASAQATASGQTTIGVDLPNIVVLHYFSSVTVDIDTTDLTAFLNFTGLTATNGINEGSATPTADNTFTADLAISPDAPGTSPTAAVLTLQNAWAVRSISSGANTELAVVVDTATMSNGGDSIAISAATVDSTNNAGVAAATIEFPTPGLVNPETGEVALTLDLTNATTSGPYTGGQFTLTATTL
jgi:hypothetical protein